MPFYSIKKLIEEVIYIIASENSAKAIITLFYSVGKFLYFFTCYRVK